MSEKSTAKKITLIILAIALIAAIVLFSVFRPHPTVLAKPIHLTTNASLPTLGNKKAKIKILAFEDLKCSNCKRYNQTLFPKIKKQLIDTGKAQYSVVLLAFIPGSPPAANAAYCLYEQSPDFFFPFIDYTYQHQLAENEDWATVSRLLQYANAAAPKANMNKLSRCIINGNYNQKVENNLKLAEKIMGQAVATPTIYINGEKLTRFSIDSVNALINKTT